MANLEESREIISGSYGLVNVCQIDTGFSGFPPNASGDGAQVDPKTNYNINDFSGSYASSKLIPFTASETSSMLRTGGVSGDIAWETNKASFNDSIAWCWGNLTDGGVGLAKFSDTANNRRIFVESHGIFYDEENEYEKIGFIVNDAVSQSQSSSICLAFIYQYNVGSYAPNGNKYVFGISHLNDGTAFRYRMYTNTLGVISYSDVATTTSLGTILNNAWNHTYGLTIKIPDIIFEFYTTTAFLGNQIIVYHPTYNFNFGSAYIQQGDVEHSDGEPETNQQGGTSTTGGGDGDFDTSSDSSNRVDETQFSTDAINSGFVTVYMPTQDNIQAFCNFLFAGITEDVSIVLKRLVSNPLDYVISLNMIHYTPTLGSVEEIKFCGIGSGVNASRVAHQFTILNCGSIDIDEQYKTFMDYMGHSKIKLYAPYCGIFPIDVNDVMGGSISLQYIIDNLSGSCVAQVYGTRYRDHVGSRNESFIDDRLLYEFTGNVFEQVPLSAVDYRGTIQGLMQIAGGVATVASGNASGLGAVAGSVMNLAPDVIHSGNGSTSYGYMGVQTPFLFLERQIQNMPIEFQSREGFTSNVYVSKLNELQGYTEIDIESFKTEFINCTDAERDEIVRLLSGGFII